MAFNSPLRYGGFAGALAPEIGTANPALDRLAVLQLEDSMRPKGRNSTIRTDPYAKRRPSSANRVLAETGAVGLLNDNVSRRSLAGY